MNCTNCNAQLEIAPSLNPFPCPHCGAELIYPPKALADDPLIRERNELQARRAQLAFANAPGCAPALGFLLLLTGSLALLGALFGDSGRDTLASSILMLLLGTALVNRARARSRKPEIELLERRIEDLDRRIQGS